MLLLDGLDDSSCRPDLLPSGPGLIWLGMFFMVAEVITIRSVPQNEVPLPVGFNPKVLRLGLVWVYMYQRANDLPSNQSRQQVISLTSFSLVCLKVC